MKPFQLNYGEAVEKVSAAQAQFESAGERKLAQDIGTRLLASPFSLLLSLSHTHTQLHSVRNV